MRLDVDEFPTWTFEMDEASAGVFRIRAEDVAGRSMELKGTDPDTLIEECKKAVKRLGGPIAGAED